MAVLGKLAYDDGATVGTLLAVRFLLAAALFWVLVLAGGAADELRALGGRDVGIAPRPGRLRLRDPGRLLLHRPRADRRVAAVAAALHLPRDGRRGRDRPRPRAHRRAACGRAGAGIRRARSRGGGRRDGRARPSGRGARARRSGGLQHLHPRQRGHRRARGAAPALGARLQRRGGHADARLRARSASFGRASSRPPAGAGWPPWPWSRRSPPSASSSPACGAWVPPPRRSSPRPSRS